MLDDDCDPSAQHWGCTRARTSLIIPLGRTLLAKERWLSDVPSTNAGHQQCQARERY